MPSIGELVIDIKASTASIQTDMTKLQGTMATSSAAIVSSLNKIVDVMVIDIGQKAVRAMVGMLERTIEAGDRIGRLSIQTGLSTEALSKYAYAAKLADVDIETFSSGMSRLSFKLEEAATSNKKLRADFASFGVDATKIRDPEQALIKLNEAFSRLYQGDKARVIAASIEFFSRAGFRLLPFLTMAPEQLRALTRELEAMGGVWDEKAVKVAEALHENLIRLGTAMETFGKNVMLAAAPAVERLTAFLLELAKHPEVIRPAIEALGKAIILIAGNFAFLIAQIADSIIAIDKFGKAMEQQNKAGWGFQKFTGPIEGLRERLREAASEQFAMPGLEVEEEKPVTWAQRVQDIFKNLPEKLTTIQKAMLDAWAASNKQASSIDSIVKKIDEETAAYGKTKDQVLLLQAIEAGASEAVLNHIAAQMNKMAEMDELRKAKGGVGEIARFYGPLAPAQMNELLGVTQQMIPAMDKLDESADKARETMFDFYKGSLTWEEQWTLKTEQIVELWRLYPELGDMAAKAIQAQNQAWDDHNKKGSILVRVQRDLSQAIADAIFQADSFGDAMQRMLLQIAEYIFQVKVLQPLLDKLFKTKSEGESGGGGGGGILGAIGSFFGGLFHFQSGGRFSTGQPFVAGEAGPEIIYPGISGAVIPNHALGGVTYNIDARGADPTVEFRIRRALRESEQRSVARSVSTTREIGLRNIT